jgi:hypothetical protein
VVANTWSVGVDYSDSYKFKVVNGDTVSSGTPLITCLRASGGITMGFGKSSPTAAFDFTSTASILLAQYQKGSVFVEHLDGSGNAIRVKNSTNYVFTVANNGNVTCGTVTSGNISSGAIVTNGNKITCGTIECRNITTNNNQIDAGTGSLTCGNISFSGNLNSSGNIVLSAGGTLYTFEKSGLFKTSQAIDVGNVKCGTINSGNVSCGNVSCSLLTTTAGITTDARAPTSASVIMCGGLDTTGTVKCSKIESITGGNFILSTKGGDYNFGANGTVGTFYPPYHIHCTNGGVTALSVTALSVTSTSDLNLKKDLSPLRNCVDKIKCLTGYTYNWKKDSEDPKRQVGLIAQEVQEVLPEAVFTSDDTLHLAYGNMAALFVEAIKELSTKIQSIEERLAKSLST